VEELVELEDDDEEEVDWVDLELLEEGFELLCDGRELLLSCDLSELFSSSLIFSSVFSISFPKSSNSCTVLVSRLFIVSSATSDAFVRKPNNIEKRELPPFITFTTAGLLATRNSILAMIPIIPLIVSSRTCFTTTMLSLVGTFGIRAIAENACEAWLVANSTSLDATGVGVTAGVTFGVGSFGGGLLGGFDGAGLCVGVFGGVIGAIGAAGVFEVDVELELVVFRHTNGVALLVIGDSDDDDDGDSG
jgi:hypothetical protein